MDPNDSHQLRWFKSSRSGGQGGNCVEVAGTGSGWYVRDSKNPTAGVLGVAPEAWRAFLDAVRADLP